MAYEGVFMVRKVAKNRLAIRLSARLSEGIRVMKGRAFLLDVGTISNAKGRSKKRKKRLGLV